jgi:hypothetical protein
MAADIDYSSPRVWYELTPFSIYVANKTCLNKMLNYLNLSHPPYGLACYVVFPLLSTARAHASLVSCIYNTWIAAQAGRTSKTTLVISKISRCACLQSAACGGIFIRCENSLSMFRLRLWSCNNSIRVALILVFTMSLRSRSSRCACLQSAACGGIFIRCENSLSMFRLGLWSCKNSIFM